MVCPRCSATLCRSPFVAWPDPTPPGLVEPWAAAPFEGLVRGLVVGHKDDGQFGHRRLLAALLVDAVRAAVASLPADDPVVLVPIPSRPGATRRRGYDAMGSLARTARRLLAAEARVFVSELLRSRGTLADQAGLSAQARRTNLAGSLWCPSGRVRRLARRVPSAHLVLCDDVITTGATVREGQRALTAAGLPPVAIAVVAATSRRFRDDSGPPSLSRGHSSG